MALHPKPPHHTRTLWPIAVLLAICPLLPAPDLYAQSDGPITNIEIAAEPDYPPYSFVDERGNADGFSVELFRSVAQKIDVGVDVEVGLWEEIREDLAQGRIDALPLVGRTPEREAYFDFTIPYMSLFGGIVVAEGDSTIQDLEDLRGKRIAVMAGDNAEEFLRRNGFTDELTTVPTFTDAIRRVAGGQSDAVLMQRLVALRLIEEEGISGVRVLKSPVREFRQEFCFAVREGDSELLALLNDGLAVAIADGTLRQLKTKWFADSDPASGTIIVGADKNFPPYEFVGEDGRPTGYNIDLVRAIAEELDLDVEFRLGEWDDIVAMLDRGDIDMLAGMVYSVERDARFDFSVAHTVHRNVVVGRDAPGRSIPTSVEELRGSRIAVQEADIMHGFAVERGLSEDLILTETQEEALRLVRENEADYALANRLTALRLLSENDWRDLVVGREELLARDYGFAVRENDTELLSLFTEGLAILEESGRYRTIYNRWLGVHEPRPLSFGELLRYSALILGPLLSVLALTFLWIRTLRKQVSLRTRELRESEHEYRLLSENTIDVIWLVSPQLRVSYVNPAVRYLTGEESSRWIGTHLLKHFAPEELRRIVSAASEQLNATEEETAFTVEIRFERQGGSPVDIEIAGKPLPGPDGTVEGFQGVARDITERKEHEATLRNSMQRTQWLANIATTYLSRNDGGNVIKAAVDQLGAYFSRLNAVSFTLDRYGTLRPEQWCANTLEPAVVSRSIDLSASPDLLSAIESPGPTTIADISAAPFTDATRSALSAAEIAAVALVPVPLNEQPRRILAFTADRPTEWGGHELLSLEEHANLLRLILDNENYQQMMDEANRSLELSLREKQTLLQEIHHRVKNNLSVVISLLRLQESAIESVDQARVAFEESRNRIYSMALVHESLYRSESLSEIEVGDYMRELVETLSESLNGDESIELRFEMDEARMNVSHAVPCGIILNELVTNAIKHAFVDHEDPKITISLLSGETEVELTVQDNGIGMPPEPSRPESSSLGLTLVHVLAEQIDARVEIVSDGGSTVRLTIPVSRGEGDSNQGAV